MVLLRAAIAAAGAPSAACGAIAATGAGPGVGIPWLQTCSSLKDSSSRMAAGSRVAILVERPACWPAAAATAGTGFTALTSSEAHLIGRRLRWVSRRLVCVCQRGFATQLGPSLFPTVLPNFMRFLIRKEGADEVGMGGAKPRLLRCRCSCTVATSVYKLSYSAPATQCLPAPVSSPHLKLFTCVRIAQYHDMPWQMQR